MLALWIPIEHHSSLSLQSVSGLRKDESIWVHNRQDVEIELVQQVSVGGIVVSVSIDEVVGQILDLHNGSRRSANVMKEHKNYKTEVGVALSQDALWLYSYVQSW